MRDTELTAHVSKTFCRLLWVIIFYIYIGQGKVGGGSVKRANKIQRATKGRKERIHFSWCLESNRAPFWDFRELMISDVLFDVGSARQLHSLQEEGGSLYLRYLGSWRGSSSTSSSCALGPHSTMAAHILGTCGSSLLASLLSLLLFDLCVCKGSLNKHNS